MMIQLSVFCIVPKYHGARSLSLGYTTTAFTFDINMLFINPSFLSTVSYSMSGYQYQQSYQSYFDFYKRLNTTLSYEIEKFYSFPDTKKKKVWDSIKKLYSGTTGLYGYKSNNPGYIGKGYGISISFENEAIMSTINNGVLTKDVNEINQSDINSLKVDFLGISYKKFSIGYAMNFSQNLNIGVTLNYLRGKGNRFQESLTDRNVFSPQKKIDSYVSKGWNEPQDKFSKIVTDFAANMSIGQYFRIGAIIKNFGNPVISFNNNKLTLNQRIIGGIAFRPSVSLSLYIDMDIKKTVLINDGDEMQPFSFGIEKSFFSNKLFVRAGFMSDLATEYFIGKKSHSLYGLGFGFNMNKTIIDCGMGIDPDGKVINIAISGFFIVQ